jgi:hypothetical protein
MNRKSLLISLALSGLVLGSAFSTQAASGPGAVGPLAPGDLYLPLVMRNAGGPSLGGCAMFPADNLWNADISSYPLDSAHSDAWVNDINGGATFLHPDFGPDPTYGIPYVVVPGSQASVTITFI